MVIMAHLAQMKSTLKSILESTDYDVTDAVSILLPKSPKKMALNLQVVVG